ncbi:unnamed protein product [Ceutorhynchus assimilis]|uniref:NADH dehydrogenase [ubiquinone] 1 beta subcomplex subunit 6 n=1 Tax=Ceutorhynchus assimilis TaxID=467358 RepID=A0A9N9QIV9_9CUCU|nr:unnamed protein product [Ceutorhynchus assimilis]
MDHASSTGGVKPMSIAGRLESDRERLLGMTDAERAFRKQWLNDQELSPNEPKEVPEMYKALRNPIRRFYRLPMDYVETSLAPVIGPNRAMVFRWVTAKVGIAVALTYWMWYYYKYNSNTWEKKGGWRASISRQACVPGDPGYPKLSDRSVGADYASRGFKDVKLNL